MDKELKRDIKKWIKEFEDYWKEVGIAINCEDTIQGSAYLLLSRVLKENPKK